MGDFDMSGSGSGFLYDKVFPPQHPNCRCLTSGITDGIHTLDEMREAVHERNRALLAECLGCGPCLVDDIVAVWDKRN